MSTRWAGMPNVEIVALCDVDESHFATKLKSLETKGLKKPATYVDFRKMLDDKTIDAVSHRHAEPLARAPDDLGLPGRQGRLRREAVLAQRLRSRSRWWRRPASTTASCRMGSQSRSSPSLREAFERLQGGELGDIYMARGAVLQVRDGIDRSTTPVAAVPRTASITTSGAVRRRSAASRKNRFHYNWHWFWDTGNGDLGNQGIHEVDIARWGLGVTHPTKVSAIGGKFMFDDDQETPNTLYGVVEFDVNGKKKMMTFEVRHWISQPRGRHRGEKPGNTIGNQFYGSKGYLVIDNYNKYYSFMGKDQAAGPGGDEATITTPTSSTPSAAASARI